MRWRSITGLKRRTSGACISVSFDYCLLTLPVERFAYVRLVQTFAHGPCCDQLLRLVLLYVCKAVG